MKSFVFILFTIFLGNNALSPAEINSNSCLSGEEKRLYKLIMEYRKSNNLKSIPLSEKLTTVAQTHARDLVENYKFDPNGKCNPHSWSKKGKWTSCCYTSDHKQASCMWNKPKELTGYEKPGYEIAYYSSKGATAEEGLAGWKVSPSHNPLLINSEMWSKVEWKAIGVGIYGEYGIVWFGEAADPIVPVLCTAD